MCSEPNGRSGSSLDGQAIPGMPCQCQSWAAVGQNMGYRPRRGAISARVPRWLRRCYIHNAASGMAKVEAGEDERSVMPASEGTCRIRRGLQLHSRRFDGPEGVVERREGRTEKRLAEVYASTTMDGTGVGAGIAEAADRELARQRRREAGRGRDVDGQQQASEGHRLALPRTQQLK